MRKTLFGLTALLVTVAAGFAAGSQPASLLAAAQAVTITDTATIPATPTSTAFVETPPDLPNPTPDVNDRNVFLFPPCYDTPLQLRPEDHFWFSRPLPSSVSNQINMENRYGMSYRGETNTHTGTDFPANAGVPVLAVADGKVVWAGFGLFGHFPNITDPYGQAVSIEHDFGYLGKPLFSSYAHLSRVDVKAGDHVVKGQQIGQVGSTGQSTGPHLHFETRVGEDSFYSTRNPTLWLVPPEGYGVIAGRIESVDFWTMVEFPFALRRLEDDRVYSMVTYRTDLSHSDEIYKETFVMGDLPAGTYQLDFWLWWRHYVFNVEVLPGMTTFVLVHSGSDPIINPPLSIPDLSSQ